MLPALLPRVWLGVGVGSVAWVPAWPANRLTPLVVLRLDLSAGIPGFVAPTGGAVPDPAWPRQEARVHKVGGQRVRAIPQP